MGGEGETWYENNKANYLQEILSYFIANILKKSDQGFPKFDINLEHFYEMTNKVVKQRDFSNYIMYFFN